SPQQTQRNRGEQTNNGTRNRTYADANRNRTYDRRDRDRNLRGRDDRREGWRDNRNNYRDGRQDGWRGDRNNYRDARRGDNRWDRRWRDNNRYNWYNYRNQYRNVFRVGRYNTPYRNWSYRRLTIGFHLDSLFYSNRYWINDPWQYRLPAVHGPYRWVRYYDDVLLVDIYSG